MHFKIHRSKFYPVEKKKKLDQYFYSHLLRILSFDMHIEAYRQKFRNCKKDSNQTHVEFARNKEQLFDRWRCSKKIDRNYDKLRQRMLVEEFKRCI